MEMLLLGVGEAFDPAELNAAALVEAEGSTLLVDCGHSAVPPLWRARPDKEAVHAVYLTHLHADHVVGLIPVLDRWTAERRQGELLILTAAPGIGRLTRLLAAGGIDTGPSSPFPVRIADAAAAGRVGPFTLRTAPTVHAAPNHAVLLGHAGRHLAWSGDGRPTPDALALYAEADLLMHECYLPERADDVPFHCDLPTVRAVAGPARIGLYHVQAGRRGDMRRAAGDDPRLFVPDAGDALRV